MTRVKTLLAVIVAATMPLVGHVLLDVPVFAQAPTTPERKQAPGPWRFIGPQPCVNPEGRVVGCPPAPRTIAIRAGRLFDSVTGQMLTRQIVIVTGERITDVGAEGAVKIPANAQVIDLSQATVLPGLIDAHTHMFNTRRPKGTTEASMLMAVQNAQADLRAGFTSARDMSSHGNGYGDVQIRNAINEGRFDGPRNQVSTLGIVWGAKPRHPKTPENPLARTVAAAADEGRSAIRLLTAQTGSSCSRPAPTRSTRPARHTTKSPIRFPSCRRSSTRRISSGRSRRVTCTAARGRRTRLSPAATPSSTPSVSIRSRRT